MHNYFIRKIHKYNNKKYTYKYYNKHNKEISKSSIEKYLNKLYIPPAYDNVKVNMNKNHDILAIGYDDKNRAQYIYNKSFLKDSLYIKYNKLIDFGNNYNKIIKKINNDINSKIESKEKQIAMILTIMIHCNFRIGNDKYTKENNSFGVSTLKFRHIKIMNNDITIDFIGKKGVRNKCSIKNNKIKKGIQSKHKRNKNERVFTYKKNNTNKNISSMDVNNYLKQFGDYTTKYFRTWISNIELIKLLLKDKTNNITKCIKLISEKLHHTPSICKKNYLEPNLIKLYNDNPLEFKKMFKGNIQKKFIEFLKKYYI